MGDATKDVCGNASTIFFFPFFPHDKYMYAIWNKLSLQYNTFNFPKYVIV